MSTGGGEEPKWSRDGKTLFYRTGTLLMSADVDTSVTFTNSPPQQIFAGLYNSRSESGLSFDVDRTSSRFLMVRVADDPGVPDVLRIIVNWARELRDQIGVATK
ncbi:hypothetical protein BH18ACI5_BH18ACI5_01870 [soil metagenome]